MFKTVTIFMPISRDNWLETIFARLELLECDRASVNLFCVVDGDFALYEKVANFVANSKFNTRETLWFKSKNKLKYYDYVMRRVRIADIHNKAKELMPKADLIFEIEDDTLIRTSALKKLLGTYMWYPQAGLVTGVQLGRHGIPSVGAYRFDDVYKPTVAKSAMPPTGTLQFMTEAIDAAGFYCYLTRYELFTDHEFKPFERNSFGPDVNYGIELRRQGYDNYINWEVTTIHKTVNRGDISLVSSEPFPLVLSNSSGRWRQERHLNL